MPQQVHPLLFFRLLWIKGCCQQKKRCKQLRSWLLVGLVGTAAGLRSRPTKDKAEIVQDVVKNVWPEIEAGKVKVIVEDVFPLEKADDAHRVLERGTHFGKVILTT